MTSANTISGGEAVVRSLIAHGIDTIFGLPGIQLDHFFNALHDHGNEIRVLNARHEQGTAYMAFGWAQSTGKIGAYAVVPGPGILNTGAALATAYGCSAKVLAFTGQIPSDTIGRGIGMLHEIPDQLGILERLTKHAARINHPSEAPSAVAEAFRQLQSGRPRPVALEVPMDILAMKAPVGPTIIGEPDPMPALDPDQIEAAAKILGNAKQPMIFVGGGAYDAAVEIRELSAMLQAPVVSYQNGRGIVDEREPYALNHPAGNEYWGDCDAALAIGCRMQIERMFWGLDDSVKVVHVDVDPTEISRIAKPAVGIVADATDAARALVNAVAGHNRKRASRADQLTALRAKHHARAEGIVGPQMAFLGALRRALPADGFFVDEFTQVAYVARIGFPVYAPRTMVTPGYQGTLGYGYATSLGVQVANPDKPVLSVNGDGGFMFTANEIATAVHHKLPVVSVVFADGAYGNVLRMQKELHDGRVIGSTFTNPDFVKLAEAYGADGRRAETPAALETAVREAFAARRPTVIEVPVGEMPEPWPVIRPAPSKPKQKE
ncbi:acetolactate synthase, large subunit protein (thiamine pyrophosphate-dependent enzyme) [alpha proteobacterium BAL199]|jgi:acetolactate synthase I/II/III large subunit|nr:acetolactate synthase, large subunit protein (thiamine pyrophosphate-dependent enzyme) [alpha proteobacterium BAL199]